ncbi:hypothetical protein [Chondrinema litorale]|uniref:hypothetical protein n=1 Tax=Chondrinema litorale TaxID=2994555 RepID=UPI0025439148|nr:hypothetical protein [Chondrinema litorale]UZR99208.1 hypothetical protein OQ292_35665 [Chondrinema litorale]
MMKRLLTLLAINLYCFLSFAQVLDAPFKQATSVKYEMAPELEGAKLKKLVVDYNDIAYVLTDKGLYRDYYGEVVSKDETYHSLADKNPVDITIQEETGILFYLFKDKYLTNNFAGTIYASVPENTYDKITVNKNMDVLLSSEKKATLYHEKEKQSDIKLPEGQLIEIYTYESDFYYLTDKELFRLEGKKWESVHKGTGLSSITFKQDKIYVGTNDGYYVISMFDGAEYKARENKLPIPAITEIMFVNMDLWFASADGAYKEESDRYRYFASKRWLDNNEVTDMAYDSDGDIYLLTPTGLNKIDYVTHTLADKAEYFQDHIRKYNMRYGFVCAPSFKEPYNRTTGKVKDHDNDGLWTTFYLGSQVFRYATTGEPIAKRYVWESFEAFERLLTVNPLKGFPSRTFERTGYKMSDPDKWRPSDEKEWEWKGTTSTDEYIAYLFVTAIMDQYMAETKEEKQRVANFIEAIMMHIIENDYYFVDADGKPTLWGRWNPEYVHKYPKHVYDRKLNATHLITGLQLAYTLTGKDIFKDEAFKMMDEHGYYEDMLTPMAEMRPELIKYDGHNMGTSWNHSDDEMAFLTYWPLYHYAFNDTLKQAYSEVIRDHWEVELPERNAVWNTLVYGTSGQINVDDVIWHLREYNLDQMEYKIKNSHRKDIEMIPENFREQTTKQLLTPGEQRTHRHNANPFELDGGSEGRSELAGDEYLLPYWMARYLKIIE